MPSFCSDRCVQMWNWAELQMPLIFLPLLSSHFYFFQSVLRCWRRYTVCVGNNMRPVKRLIVSFWTNKESCCQNHLKYNPMKSLHSGVFKGKLHIKDKLSDCKNSYIQCWARYFEKVINYSYSLHVPKSNWVTTQRYQDALLCAINYCPKTIKNT